MWRRSWAFAYEEIEEDVDGPLQAAVFTARFSPYCLHNFGAVHEHIDGPVGVSLDVALDWCRAHAARVEVYIGDRGSFSAGHLKVPRRPPLPAEGNVLKRRRPRGFEWLDREPSDSLIAWTVRLRAHSMTGLDPDERRAAGRAAVATIAAVAGVGAISWSTDPQMPQAFRIRARCLAATSGQAEEALLTAAQATLPLARWRLSVRAEPE